MSTTPEHTIVVPEGLNERQMIEFVRAEIRKAGGDPDTAYPLDFEGFSARGEVHEGLIPISMKFTYDHFVPAKPKPSPVTMDYQQGFFSPGD